MEKNRIRPIATGKNMRMSYSQTERSIWKCPTLSKFRRIPISGSWMKDLKRCLMIFLRLPITADNLSLEFVDFKLCEEDVKYSIEEVQGKRCNICSSSEGEGTSL